MDFYDVDSYYDTASDADAREGGKRQRMQLDHDLDDVIHVNARARRLLARRAFDL